MGFHDLFADHDNQDKTSWLVSRGFTTDRSYTAASNLLLQENNII